MVLDYLSTDNDYFPKDYGTIRANPCHPPVFTMFYHASVSIPAL